MTSRFGFPKRWQCSECKESWTARLRPDHHHPNHLQRLCSLQECGVVIAPGTRTCSEEHALRLARRVRGLPEDPPGTSMTGQWLFSHRQRLHVSRSTVSYWLTMSGAVDAYPTNLWRIEINNLPLPKKWLLITEAIAQANRPEMVDELVHEKWPITRKRSGGSRGDTIPEDVLDDRLDCCREPLGQAEAATVSSTDNGHLPQHEAGSKRKYELSLEVHDWAPKAPRYRLVAEVRPDGNAKISIVCDSWYLTTSRIESQPSKLLFSVVELLEEMERPSHRLKS